MHTNIPILTLFRSRSPWLLGLAALSLTLATCSTPKDRGALSERQAVQAETLTVGSLLPLSGPNAHYGEDNKAGMEVALEEVNREGISYQAPDGTTRRYRLQIQFENSLGGPNNTFNGTDKIEQLFSAGVPVVLGEHFSTNTLALATKAKERQRVLLTPCSTNYKLREQGPWVFRILPTDYDQAVRMAKYGRTQLKATRAAILNIDNDYGRDLAKTFEGAFTASGGTVVYNRRFAQEQREFGGFVRSLLTSGAEFLFLVGHTQEMADLLRTKERIERSTRGPRLPILGTDGMYDETFLKQAGQTAEGIVLASAGFNAQSNDSAVTRFVAAFQARHGRLPNLWSAAAYDAVLVVADAIRKRGPTPDGVRNGLTQIRNLPGATGMNSFDSTGGPTGKSVYTFAVRQGKFEQID